MKPLLCTLLFTLTYSLCTYAQTFEVGGLKYTVTSGTNVSVSKSASGCPSGGITIPASVENTGITYSVTSIGDQAFVNCSSLTSITIPNFVASIGSGAFGNCSSLTSVTLPNLVTSIAPHTFSGCSSLISVTIPDSVTSIGAQAFVNCSSLTSITIPNSVASIGSGAFALCSSLTGVTIPNSVTSIGSGAFVVCSSLTSITIPNLVTSIEAQAFGLCSSLTSVTLPTSVTSIGNEAFANCSSLKELTCQGATPPTLGSDAFSNVPTDLLVLVPEGSGTAYRAASGWSGLNNVFGEVGGAECGGNAIDVDASNNTENLYFRDGNGEVLAMINANGNNLGTVTVKSYLNTSGTVRTYNSEEYMDRDIDISVATQPTTPVTVRLYYTADELAGLTSTLGDIEVIKTTGHDLCGAGSYGGSNPQVIAQTASNDDWNPYIEFSVSSFSSFFSTGNASSVLPVELVSVDAHVRGSQVIVDWRTASEINNQGFEIERSVDGRNFASIGYVRGKGTTTDQTTYNYIDTDPIYGVSYYRLKQVDYDGGYEYSKIISVRMEGERAYRIYPNPTIDVLHISKASSYSIINGQGHVVTRGNANRIDVSQLPLGLYIIRLDNGAIERFVKE